MPFKSTLLSILKSPAGWNAPNFQKVRPFFVFVELDSAADAPFHIYQYQFDDSVEWREFGTIRLSILEPFSFEQFAVDSKIKETKETTTRKNSVNFEFSINVESSHSKDNYSNMSQPCSAAVSCFSDDSLEEILALTARHEALMAYYFLGDKTKVSRSK
jgi:hypothetical protein